MFKVHQVSSCRKAEGRKKESAGERLRGWRKWEAGAQNRRSPLIHNVTLLSKSHFEFSRSNFSVRTLGILIPVLETALCSKFSGVWLLCH
jgi:hypothetical protein